MYLNIRMEIQPGSLTEPALVNVDVQWTADGIRVSQRDLTVDRADAHEITDGLRHLLIARDAPAADKLRELVDAMAASCAKANDERVDTIIAAIAPLKDAANVNRAS